MINNGDTYFIVDSKYYKERSDLGGLLGGMGGGAPTVEQSKFWWQYPISVGAQISIPLFAGFKKTNQLREVRNQMKQLEIQREYAEEGIRLQVEQAINTLLTARETMLSNELTVEQAKDLYKSGVISGGMIPKVDCCIEAIEKGVKHVVIMDGRVPHSILMELLTDEGAGTMVMPD